MKTAVALLAFFAQFGMAPQDVPLADPTPDFPLHVHLFSARFGTDTTREYRSLQAQQRGAPGYLRATGSYHGYGSGNLLNDSARGFDYAFDCGHPFAENELQPDFYQARWKKPGQRLEILMQRVGTDHADTCELRVAMKPRAFDSGDPRDKGKASLSASNLWEDPGVAFSEPDPDYPVHLHVITNRRAYNRTGTSGFGTADILGTQPGDPPQGLEYTFNCDRGFLSNTQKEEFFQARWVKQDLRMEILTQRMGSDKVDRCTINVALKSAPFPY